MNTTTMTPPQMGFEFIQSDPGTSYVNTLGAAPLSGFADIVDSGDSAGDSLGRMYVDDRVLGLGKTNWRELLDRAMASGHIELYTSDDGRQGLRIPGFRFGPIVRMPEQGPEYIKRSNFERVITKAVKKSSPTKSGRQAAGTVLKVEWVLSSIETSLNIYEGRKLKACLGVTMSAIPFATGQESDDQAVQVKYFSDRFSKEIDVSAGDVIALGEASAQALTTLLAGLGK